MLRYGYVSIYIATCSVKLTTKYKPSPRLVDSEKIPYTLLLLILVELVIKIIFVQDVLSIITVESE